MNQWNNTTESRGQSPLLTVEQLHRIKNKINKYTKRQILENTMPDLYTSQLDTYGNTSPDKEPKDKQSEYKFSFNMPYSPILDYRPAFTFEVA